MRLQKLTVDGLFGLFDHTIDFKLRDRITIIHAPNGFGKTVILKFIEGMFGGSLAVFRDYEYSKIVFYMDSGAILKVTQGKNGELFPTEEPDGEDRSYKIDLIDGVDEYSWNPSDVGPRERINEVPMSMIEQVLPFLRRVAPSRWRDTRTGKVLDYRTILVEYSDQFPPSMRRRRIPDWLSEFRDGQSCRLIETHRLLVAKRERRVDADNGSLTPAVTAYAEELSIIIGRALAQSATISQSLDRTFPNRLLARLRDSRPPLSEGALRDELSKLEQQRARLAKVDLLDKLDESAIIESDELNEETRRILTEYVADAKEKLAVYDDLLSRIEAFTEILADKLRFKSVNPSRKSGFLLKDFRGRDLSPSSLSSGEQHELVLMFDLIFKTSPGSLILIDEPEISLHIGWQKRFLSDLRKIISLTAMDVVISTHSPQLIGGDIDLMVKLTAPSDV